MGVANAIREMIARGLSLDDALRVAEAFEDGKVDPRKARNARYYQARKERLKASETVLSQSPSETVLKASETVLNEPPPRARVDSDSLDSESTGKNLVKHNTRRKDGYIAIDELTAVLKPEIAQAVIDHRQTIRKPLSGYAAHLLAKDFAETGHPDDAAQTMIARGWQGFRAEWYKNDKENHNGRGQQGRSGPQRHNMAEVAGDMLRQFDERAAQMRSSDGVGSGGEAFSFFPRLGSK